MRELTDDQIAQNLNDFFQVAPGVDVTRERVTSFDYCFNHFQGYRERGAATLLATDDAVERSCLHLGFYLASWGMLRGSSELLQKSLRHYVKVIELIAQTPEEDWIIDVDRYSDDSIGRLVDLERKVREAVKGKKEASETLSTKIMLGVFGNVPAFDSFFRTGFRVTGFSAAALKDLRVFHDRHVAALEQSISTREFRTGEASRRRYTRAKLLDMVFFIEGGR